MKYILPEGKLFDTIYKFIDGEFEDDNLDWDYDIDPDTNEPEKNIINFYGQQYINGNQDEWTFQYVKKEYYEGMSDEQFKFKWIDKAPLLDLLHRDFSSKMDALFGTFWRPVFEKWFEKNYPEFPVKTYLYHY